VRLPDATDHIRLGPVRALRAVFSGVGQLLLAADRLREEDARQDQESGQGQGEQDTLAPWDGGLSPSVRLLSPTGMPVPSSRGARSAPGGKSGLAAGGKSQRGGDRRTGGRQRRAGNAGTGRRSGRHRNGAEPPRFRSLDLTGNVRMLGDQDVADLAAEQFDQTTFPPTESQPTESQPLPIAGYDDLSLPSLRARLRNLGAADLRDLIAHERSHANREDVVAMFERRIVKLEDAD
jgi:hypothetical protein